MRIKTSLLASTVLAATAWSHVAHADMEAAERWVAEEFDDSTLSADERLAEMKWFIDAATDLDGVSIKVLSDGIPVHKYDAEVLAKAFTEITGIEVTHEVVDEAGVIERIQTQMQSGENIYDAYINDSDLIGTHFRNSAVMNLTEYMEGPGAKYTNPTLDLDDFIGIDFVKDVDGDIYQLPAQQFANLYWFRADWFEREDFRKQFQEIYGYELGVPVNWSAYEDIADFFTNHVKEIDGVRVYGHMDYGKKDPSLGWRFTDAWLSMAGAGDVGIPNGIPVDEWGIRVEGCHPVGASVSRGGATNGPAAVYSLQKYIDWMADYAPPEAQAMNFYEAGLVPNQGQIAQQIFWYTVFAESAAQPGVAVADENGLPKWRMAPSPAGAYWEEGMKLGYQDVAAFTIMNSASEKGKAAAWLYSQFVTSKTVSLERTLHGFTPIRESDINSDVMSEWAPKLGGLVEFYRSPARVAWTPTGTNVPDYPKLAQLWWENVAAAVTGEMSSQEAMDRLAGQMDRVLQRLERAGMDRCAPKLNEEKDPEFWFSQPGAPKAKLANEKPQGQTVPYTELLQAWQEGRVK
ncbi:ABC transporter substrate-binding protein [Nitratireductor kimnyeongensis]|uniref:ABC transporter substrate-binding protein n=1 Tax=Nitratireductor kimnyeongensis TaxID=430679 RepID=A0ABW0T824_9HYPH|nr:ABC transporter substrate-binding protein [Nitratireductor kimnyeongensis]QZZ36456.1 ABC transporter substrate-binding protein [Nitratireductor kimnyeongensis]